MSEHCKMLLKQIIVDLQQSKSDILRLTNGCSNREELSDLYHADNQVDELIATLLDVKEKQI